MNSKNEIKNNSMLYISFNQDNSFFSIGTERGFQIYQTEPFNGPYKKEMDGGIGIVEMIYNSNFLVLLGGGEIPKFSKNKVVIWDDNENKVISELKFTTPILSVKYRKDYLFILCRKRIYIFNFDTYEIFDTIDTGNNSKELIAINQTSNPLIVAYPSPEGDNKINLINYPSKETITIKVQDDPISKISINNNGTLIASANESGTIIRIHSCKDGFFLQEFKRGMEKAKINSICFDADTKFMAVSSSRGTIHIFSMGSTIKNLKEHESNKTNEEKNNTAKKEKKEKTTKEKKKKKDKKDVDSKENKKDDKTNDNENEIEDEKNNENKIEANIEENKMNEENKEKMPEEKDKDNEKINSTSEEETKDDKDNDINIEKKTKIENIIDRNEIKEIIETDKGDMDLPENSKSFFSGIFGSKTEKSFAKVRLKSQESICAFIKSNLLAIVTSDNKYYQYEIDLKSGGDCKKKLEKDLTLNK